ncbi:hypothetical protein AB0K60_00180 [Thermopolyspora sp. NPDC052614]|uniref:hypothetical protein n=1 Tax=Thermopolyspora sp. NPDC052614 TaxID=3155682 RepID=UPI00343AF3B0
MIMKRFKFSPVCLAMALALAGATGCGEIQQGIADGVQAGEAEGSVKVLGRLAIEQLAGVKLADDLDCESGELTGTKTPIECTGQTADGRKASVNGIATSAEPQKAVVKGKFTLVFNGKKLGELDCIGFCSNGGRSGDSPGTAAVERLHPLEQ